MADTFLTHTIVAERSLFRLKNELVFGANVFLGYDKEFHARQGYKTGNSVNIQKPNKFRTKAGPTLDDVDLYEQSTSVTVDVHRHVAWDFLMTDMVHTVEQADRKYLTPAMQAIANYIDYTGLSEYVNIYNQVGTAGTTPSTFQVLADAAERLDNEAVPRDNRKCILSPKAHWSMAAGELKGVFNENMVDTLIRKGFIGRFAAADFFMSQNINTHTTGAFEADIYMNGATSEGASSVVTDGWDGSSDVHQGDIFTIATVYGVNPVSGDVWEGNQLRQFVVTAQTDDTAADMTIPISPTIYSSAAGEVYLPYQTVGDLPANNDLLTFVGTASTGYPINLMYDMNAFALTMLPFKVPKGIANGEVVTVVDPDMGFALTLAYGFDLTNYKEITRVDVLFGWDTIYPELACRIIG